MASEEMGLVPPQQRLDNGLSSRLDNGLSSQLVFQDQGLRFGRVGDPEPPKTRELSGFIDGRFFQSRGAAEFPRSLYGDEHHRQESRNWDGNGRDSTTPSGDGSEGDEDEEEDEVDEGDGEVEALVGVDGSNGKDDIGNGTGESANADSIENGKSKFLSYVGSNRGVIIEEGNVMQSGNDNGHAIVTPDDNHHRQGRVNQYHQNAVTVADPNGDFYYLQYLQGSEGLGSGIKVVDVENGSGFSGRKEVLYSSESGESLRVILSDPLTGTLMDDAMILPCGHSFGGDGIQHVLRMKACYTCSELVSEESVSPNLSLRAAVQAFRREEELQVYRSSKKRSDRFEQDKGNCGDSMAMDHLRGRGVQFPFAVTDRVIIKGNKRTPQRFVGREAIVTTQCLNGWYVVKTLDNAESVKLQYRSLSKVADYNLSLKSATSKMMTPNWL